MNQRLGESICPYVVAEMELKANAILGFIQMILDEV